MQATRNDLVNILRDRQQDSEIEFRIQNIDNEQLECIITFLKTRALSSNRTFSQKCLLAQ